MQHKTNIRRTPEQARRWAEAAEREGYSNTSEWIRRTLDREAKKSEKMQQ